MIQLSSHLTLNSLITTKSGFLDEIAVQVLDGLPWDLIQADFYSHRVNIYNFRELVMVQLIW